MADSQASQVKSKHTRKRPVSKIRMKKREKWTDKEDKILKAVVRGYGLSPIPWQQVAPKISGRTARQCKERYMNVLNPANKKKNWRSDELRIIFSMRAEIGTKWVDIAKALPGRAKIDVKNIYYSSMRKLEKRQKKNGSKQLSPLIIIEEKQKEENDKRASAKKAVNKYSRHSPGNQSASTVETRCFSVNSDDRKSNSPVEKWGGYDKHSSYPQAPLTMTCSNEDLACDFDSERPSGFTGGTGMPHSSSFDKNFTALTNLIGACEDLQSNTMDTDFNAAEESFYSSPNFTPHVPHLDEHEISEMSLDPNSKTDYSQASPCFLNGEGMDDTSSLDFFPPYEE